MSGYIWYSSGSDVSGPKLAEALGFTHGKKTPKIPGLDVLIGWGCRPETRQAYEPEKIKVGVEEGTLRILNHPEEVIAARDKLGTLVRLRDAGMAVPGMVDLREVAAADMAPLLSAWVNNGILQLPCVGFHRFHKGKPVFCWTKEDLVRAVETSALGNKEEQRLDYFRSLFHGTEYRIHVFRNEALCAETKTLSQNPVVATAKSILGKLKKRVLGDVKTTEEELQVIVEELATDLLKGPSHLQRSIQHGWEMKDTPLDQVPAPVIAAAITALDTVGLDMGAVSVILEGDQGIVTNVTTSPGLDSTKINLYTAAIKEFVGSENKTGKKEVPLQKAGVAPSERASQEILARLTQKVRTGQISQRQAEELLAALE